VCSRPTNGGKRGARAPMEWNPAAIPYASWLITIFCEHDSGAR
jgi:hypothetical protein